jgi:hypothetical protein
MMFGLLPYIECHGYILGAVGHSEWEGFVRDPEFPRYMTKVISAKDRGTAVYYHPETKQIKGVRLPSGMKPKQNLWEMLQCEGATLIHYAEVCEG